MTSIPSNPNNLPPRQDPDTYAKTYATQNGITVDEAKEQLRAKYGDPKPQNDESIFSNNNTENSSANLSNISLDDLEDANNTEASPETGFMKFIHDLFGLSSDKTEEQKDLNPDEVAQEYATKHNITLEEAKAELQKLYGNIEQR